MLVLNLPFKALMFLTLMRPALHLFLVLFFFSSRRRHTRCLSDWSSDVCSSDLSSSRTMPRLEDLPIPGQNELRAVRGEAAPSDHPEKRRMGLLQRLASVGLGRRDGDSEAASDARPQSDSPRPRRPGDSRDPVSEYGKRQGHQALDPLGRQAPVHNSPEEDQLEIPAFLRRQAT